MKMRALVVALSILAIGASQLAVPAAAADTPPSRAPAPTMIVRGWAYTGAPVAGADVLVITYHHGLPRITRGTTDELGTFTVTAARTGFVHVLVSGGTVRDEAFDGHLEAKVAGYGITTHIVDVNEVTTLASVFDRQNPDVPDASIAPRVASFLGLPTSAFGPGQLHQSTETFSHEEFTAQASSAGGFDRFVRQLAAEMRDPDATHAFTRRLLHGPAQLLANSIIGNLAGASFGFVLRQVFDNSGDVEAQVLGYLNQLTTQVSAIKSKVDQISQQLVQQSYDQYAAALSQYTSVIQSAWGTLQYIATVGPPSNAAEEASLNSLRSIIQTQADMIINGAYLTRLNDLLNGTATTGGYLAWSNLLRSRTTVWSPATTSQLTDYFDYYDLVQAQAVWLIGERYAERGITTDAYNALVLGPFNTQRAAQLARRDAIRPLTVGIDTRTGLMWPLSVGNYGPQVVCNMTYVRYQPCIAPFGVQDTVNAINASRLEGYTDWRVPSISELQNFPIGPDYRGWLDRTFQAPQMFRSCDASGCSSWVWSSTGAGGARPCGDRWVWNSANAWETATLNVCERATVWVTRATTEAERNEYWVKP